MMKYRVKVVQIRRAEIEVEAPHYDIAQLRAQAELERTPWQMQKMEIVQMEMFGDPTKGDLFDTY